MAVEQGSNGVGLHSQFRVYINGAARETDTTFPKVDPATAETIAHVPDCTQQDADDALDAAVKARKAWRNVSKAELCEMIAKAKEVFAAHVEELKALLVSEQGKLRMEAEFEVGYCLPLFDALPDFVPDEKPISKSDNHDVILKRPPAGVVLAICPWNYPVVLALCKMLKALACRNTVIVKPSPHTPLCTLRIGELLGPLFPPGVVNVLSGSDSGSFNLGGYLSSSKKVNTISFTGSVRTGMAVQALAARNLTRTCLELGGNDAAIVLPDANVEKAAEGIMGSALTCTGQVCCAVKRAYVHESIIDAFVAACVKICKGKTMGAGSSAGSTLAPLNNLQQLERVKGLLAKAREEGGTVHCGGEAHSELKGFFMSPAIVTGLKEGSALVDEEQFGPVLPVLTFSTPEEAIERANASDFGLGGSVWTSDLKYAAEVAGQLEAGTVWINDHTTPLGGAPFGGVKLSGIGREGDFGEADWAAFTEMQAVKVPRA